MAHWILMLAVNLVVPATMIGFFRLFLKTHPGKSMNSMATGPLCP